jgi:hypothetical protein
VLANGGVLVSRLKLTLTAIQTHYISKNDRASSAGFSDQRPNGDRDRGIQPASSYRRKAFVSTAIGVAGIPSLKAGWRNSKLGIQLQLRSEKGTR